MTKRDWQWHKFFRLITGITEHKALVTRPNQLIGCFVPGFNGGIYPLGDIRRLFIKRDQDGHIIAIKAIITWIIANALNSFTYNLLDIDIGSRADFPEDQYQAGVDCGLAGHPG